jgi:dolichol-phosphate mannosyltransferase
MLLRFAQAGAGAVVLARLARGRSRRPPLAAARAPRPVSVVVPARDEAARIGPCLAGLAGDPDVLEVIVVDDGSTDDTAAIARAAGARVISGTRRDGWVGKPWALQQGLEAARGELVVTLDADTRPKPGLVGALAAALEEADLVTAGARFTAAGWIHPAMLATLVYRFGPADAPGAPPARLVANGQVTAVRRAALLAAGGYAAAAGHLTDDVALARALARDGWRVVFRDGSALVDVAMTPAEWARSIALADVTSPGWRAADVAVVWLAQGLPVLRLLAGRPGRLDLALLALRAALLPALARSYARRGPAFWLSPLADPVAAAALTSGAVRPARIWRGRTYPARTAPRSASSASPSP